MQNAQIKKVDSFPEKKISVKTPTSPAITVPLSSSDYISATSITMATTTTSCKSLYSTRSEVNSIVEPVPDVSELIRKLLAGQSVPSKASNVDNSLVPQKDNNHNEIASPSQSNVEFPTPSVSNIPTTTPPHLPYIDSCYQSSWLPLPTSAAEKIATRVLPDFKLNRAQPSSFEQNPMPSHIVEYCKTENNILEKGSSSDPEDAEIYIRKHIDHLLDVNLSLNVRSSLLKKLAVVLKNPVNENIVRMNHELTEKFQQAVAIVSSAVDGLPSLKIQGSVIPQLNESEIHGILVQPPIIGSYFPTHVPSPWRLLLRNYKRKNRLSNTSLPRNDSNESTQHISKESYETKHSVNVNSLQFDNSLNSWRVPKASDSDTSSSRTEGNVLKKPPFNDGKPNGKFKKSTAECSEPKLSNNRSSVARNKDNRLVVYDHRQPSNETVLHGKREWHDEGNSKNRNGNKRGKYNHDEVSRRIYSSHTKHFRADAPNNKAPFVASRPPLLLSPPGQLRPMLQQPVHRGITPFLGQNRSQFFRPRI